MQFSFIDFGTKDFVRDDNYPLILDFDTYDDADEFIMKGGLNDFGWTNKGTRKWCWDEEE